MANTGLKNYQRAMRKAKQFAKAGTELSEAYSKYVKTYYETSKELRKGKVKITKGHKQGLFRAGEVYEGWQRSDVMSIKEFKRYTAKYKDISASDIALKQYNLIDVGLATELARKLKEAAQVNPALARLVLNRDGELKYTVEQIRARQIPTEVWNEMSATAKNSGLTVSQYFFGSI